MVARVPALHWLVVRKLMARFRTVHGEMLARARFCEDALERAVEYGIHQYVIIGAGLDSFALRRQDLAAQLTVFEFDHPASQAEKRARLARLGETMPGNLVFVPVDLERETMGQALTRSRFDREAPAFFGWLGVTYYLSREAVSATLRGIADTAALGSEVVLDYSVPAETLSLEERECLQHVLAFAARRGEPWKSFFTPGEFAREAQALGYEEVATISPEEQERLYFLGRDDDLSGPKWPRFAHLRLDRRPTGILAPVPPHSDPGLDRMPDPLGPTFCHQTPHAGSLSPPSSSV